MSSADLVGLIAAVLILIAGVSVFIRMRMGSRRKKVSDRMEQIVAIKDIKVKGEFEEDDDIFRALDNARANGGLIGAVRRAILEGLRPIGGRKALRTVILMSLLAASIGFLVSQRVLGLSPFVCTIIGVVFGIAIPVQYVQGAAHRARDKFLDTFPDAIDLIVRAIRAGIPTSESIAAAGRELAEPLATEFRRISQEVAIGVSPDRALTEAADRIRISDFNFFAVTLVLQRETGGNLAETLDNLSALLRKRREMRLKIRALTSEGRFTSKVIAGLPVLVMTALFFLNRPYVKLLFTDPTGQMFLGIAVGLIIIGSTVLNRMIKLDV